jgi:hypothetical protein
MIWLKNCSIGVKQQSLTHPFYKEQLNNNHSLTHSIKNKQLYHIESLNNGITYYHLHLICDAIICHDCDRVVFAFITTYAISAYYH